MNSSSMRRSGRHQWRFIVGMFVLALLVIASASYAGGDPDPLPAPQVQAPAPTQTVAHQAQTLADAVR
jgi:hypothetical protein